MGGRGPCLPSPRGIERLPRPVTWAPSQPHCHLEQRLVLLLVTANVFSGRDGVEWFWKPDNKLLNLQCNY